MGLAFFGKRRSKGYITDSLNRWLKSGELEDPLLGFVDEIEFGKSKAYGETVQIAPLFNANAAAADAIENPLFHSLKSRCGIDQAASRHGWLRVSPRPDMTSQILLFESEDDRTRKMQAEQVQHQFLQNGVAVSAYGNGLVRISTPPVAMTEQDSQRLSQAFARR